MRVVLDATVLSNFALIGHSDYLPQAWTGELTTTEETWAEIQTGIKLGRLPESDWSWLTVLSLTEAECQARNELIPPLDLGEAACLALVQSRDYAFLTDDRIARREARHLGVPLSGTLGVLGSLLDERLITIQEADDALQQMIESGYHSPVQSIKELQ